MIYEEKNAKIKRVSLAIEDHGILTAWLELDYNSGGQGFGGYALDEYDPNKKCRVGHAFGTEFILRVLTTIGVDSWEKLPGTSCRVRAEHSKVHSIGHYLKDVWFSPKEVAREFFPED